MNRKSPISPSRISLMLFGILLIGICVAFFRLAGFGVDPFSCMNLGISKFIHWSFGNWQLVANAVLFIAVFFGMRSCIGAGTIINMVFVGYIADFLCWIADDVLQITLSMPVRVLFLALALLFASSGCACYMKADLGIAPYDSVAPIIEKLSGGRIPFHIGRVLSDLAVTAVGVLFCALSGESIWTVIGVGTIVNALCNGPLIKLFRTLIDRLLPESAASRA